MTNDIASKRERFDFLVVLALPLVGLALLGLVVRDNALARAYFELSFVYLSLMTLLRYRTLNGYGLLSLVVCAAWIVYGAAVVYYDGKAGVLDYFLAYKAFYYVLFLSLAAGKPLLSEARLATLFRLLLLVFAIKYSYARFIQGEPRPEVYIENNFELMLLILIYARLSAAERLLALKDSILLFYVVFISGSRSSFLALFIVMFLMQGLKVDRFLVFRLVGGALVALAGLYLFAQRMTGEGIESIDRYKFFTVFLTETSGWGVWDWIFGARPITPLSSFACAELSFYKNLFSFTQEGTCYSVILHSYLMRALFDHGLFGLFFLFMVIYKMMRSLGYGVVLSLVVIMILASTGLSVSSLNNVYVGLGLLFVLTTLPKPREAAA